MDLKQFADQIEAMTCIMSVEEKEDGSQWHLVKPKKQT